MTLGMKISHLRKENHMTQESLAAKLDVTNQAVSKWETDQCCPDPMLLPKIADLFGVSIDTLFDRPTQPSAGSELPWEDDGVLRAVIFSGRKLLSAEENPCKNIYFSYEGEALNIESAFSVQCDSVTGNVSAGGSINCDEVEGDLYAGGSINCDEVNGDVYAGGSITCDEIHGSVNALGSIRCDHVDHPLEQNSSNGESVSFSRDFGDRLRQNIESELSKMFSGDFLK